VEIHLKTNSKICSESEFLYLFYRCHEIDCHPNTNHLQYRHVPPLRKRAVKSWPQYGRGNAHCGPYEREDYVKHETQYGRFATAQPPFFVDEQADGWMYD